MHVGQILWDRVSRSLPGWPWTFYLPVSAFPVARITGPSHQAWPFPLFLNWLKSTSPGFRIILLSFPPLILSLFSPFLFSSYMCIRNMDDMSSQSSQNKRTSLVPTFVHYTHTYMHTCIYVCVTREQCTILMYIIVAFFTRTKLENTISIKSNPCASSNPDMSFPVSVLAWKQSQVLSIEPWFQPIQNVLRWMILLCVCIHAHTHACVYPCMWLCEFSFQEPQAVDTVLVLKKKKKKPVFSRVMELSKRADWTCCVHRCDRISDDSLPS